LRFAKVRRLIGQTPSQRPTVATSTHPSQTYRAPGTSVVGSLQAVSTLEIWRERNLSTTAHRRPAQSPRARPDRGNRDALRSPNRWAGEQARSPTNTAHTSWPGHSITHGAQAEPLASLVREWATACRSKRRWD